MAAMGYVATADCVDGTRYPRARNSNSSNSLRDHKVGSVRSYPNDPDNRNCKSLAQEAERRQFSILAQLVEAIDPLDAEKLARSLMNEFGSLGQVLDAGVSVLARYTGNLRFAEILQAARIAVVEGLREEICRTRVNLRDSSFIAYLVAETRGAEENLHAVFLDHHGRYLKDERVASGDWATISVRLRPLFRRSVELCAAKIVLCHNHPSGNPNPSHNDINFTLEAAKVSRSLGIELVDHLILSGNAVFSMRAAGLFK